MAGRTRGVTLTFKGNTRDLARAFKKMTREAAEFAVVVRSANVPKFGAELQTLSGDTASLGETFSAVGGTALQAFGAVAAALVGVNLALTAMGAIAAVAFAGVAGGAMLATGALGAIGLMALNSDAKIKKMFKSLKADVMKSIATAASSLIPAVKKITKTVTGLIHDIETPLKSIFGDIGSAAAATAGAVADAFRALTPSFQRAAHTGLGLWNQLLKAGAPLVADFASILDTLTRGLQNFGGSIVTSTVGALHSFLALIEQLVSIGAGAWPEVMRTLSTLLDALTSAFRTVAPVIHAAMGAFNDFLTAAAAPLLTWIADVLVALEPLSTAFMNVAGKVLKTAVMPILTALVPILQAVADSLTPLVTTTLVQLITQIAELGVGVLKGLTPALAALLPSIIAVANGLGQELLTYVVKNKGPLLDLVAAASNFLITLTPLVPVIGAMATQLLQSSPPLIALTAQMARFGTWAINEVVVPALNVLNGTVLRVFGSILDTAATTFGWLPQGIGKHLKDADKKFHQFQKATTQAINSIPTYHRLTIGTNGAQVAGVMGGVAAAINSIPTYRHVTIDQTIVSRTIGRTYGPRPYATGGLVTGGVPGRDSVPAMLMPGEYVLTARAVRRLGRGFLDSINGGRQTVTDLLARGHVARTAAPAVRTPERPVAIFRNHFEIHGNADAQTVALMEDVVTSAFERLLSEIEAA